MAGQPGPIRGGVDAPRGESAALARMTLPQPRGGRSRGVAAGPGLTGEAGAGTTQEAPPLPELNDGFDPALFAPTDRPNEPVTSGAPFGPGSNFVQAPTEDSRTFMLRVADQLSTNPELASYVARIRAGA